MPVHPQAQALLDAAAGAPQVQDISIAEGRELLEQRARMTAGQPEPMAEVRDLQMPGPGGALRLRVYRPTNEQNLPGLVYFHGGGWVRGSLTTHDVLCRALAKHAQCVVVSVDYRLAPEAKFPAAAEDAWAATRWVAANTQALGIDPDRLAVGGDSAGGQLTAAVALQAREHHGPRLVYQLMIYPVVDYNLDTPSYRDHGDGYLLTRDGMKFYWDQYLNDPSEADDVRACPLRASSLANLPPTLVMTAEFDPLRDEGRAYAERLRSEGTPTEYREVPGMLHGFAGSTGVLDVGREAVREAAALLRAAFARPAAVAG
jgi:acetyl esterase/lipase